MDNTNYTTEHRKCQHMMSEERHEIEVRLKDGWSIYRIAKHLHRPYNTIKNEIKRGTVSLYNGNVKRYKADEGKRVYLEPRELPKAVPLSRHGAVPSICRRKFQEQREMVFGCQLRQST